MTSAIQPEETRQTSAATRYPVGLTLTCPHCGNRALVRTSRLVSESFREAWGVCPTCTFSGKAHVAWDIEAAPSLMPNPKVRLPRMEYRDAVDDLAAADIAGRPQMDMFANTG